MQLNIFLHSSGFKQGLGFTQPTTENCKFGASSGFFHSFKRRSLKKTKVGKRPNNSQGSGNTKDGSSFKTLLFY